MYCNNTQMTPERVKNKKSRHSTSSRAVLFSSLHALTSSVHYYSTHARKNVIYCLNIIHNEWKACLLTNHAPPHTIPCPPHTIPCPASKSKCPVREFTIYDAADTTTRFKFQLKKVRVLETEYCNKCWKLVYKLPAMQLSL